MDIAWNVARACVVAIIVLAVAELSKRYPRSGALLLSLPILSFLAFLASWFQHRDAVAISRLAKETLILVPLGLPFFIPFILTARLGFWGAFCSGMLLATLSIGAWLLIGSSK